ncbi:MAG: hypothetical protein JXA30_16215 [Deltaproteobacteria bacterium]|nr:hypothetical protein [Deltaproteobacteria bacterium]
MLRSRQGVTVFRIVRVFQVSRELYNPKPLENDDAIPSSGGHATKAEFKRRSTGKSELLCRM